MANEFNPGGDLLSGLQTGMKLAQMKEQNERAREKMEMEREQLKLKKIESMNGPLLSLAESSGKGDSKKANFYKQMSMQRRDAIGMQDVISDQMINAIGVSPELGKVMAKTSRLVGELAADGTLSASDFSQVYQDFFTSWNEQGGDPEFGQKQLLSAMKTFGDLQTKKQTKPDFSGIKLVNDRKDKFNAATSKLSDAIRDLSEQGDAILVGDATELNNVKKALINMRESGKLSDQDFQLVGESRGFIAKTINQLEQLSTGNPSPEERIRVMNSVRRTIQAGTNAYGREAKQFANQFHSTFGMDPDQIVSQQLDPVGIRNTQLRVSEENKPLLQKLMAESPLQENNSLEARIERAESILKNSRFTPEQKQQMRKRIDALVQEQRTARSAKDSGVAKGAGR